MSLSGRFDGLARWWRPKRMILGERIHPVTDDVRVHVPLSGRRADAGEFHHTITAVADELFCGALVEFPPARGEFFA